MKLRLEHLLYTSRLSFETIARSPGIDRRLRGQLERWASDYPVKCGDGRDAPLVVRGFPLDGEDGAWGVMILCYTGGDMSRPEGNYLAHAFVVPGNAWRELWGNLAWIAAHVPFWGTYRSQAGVGQDEIEPVEIEIDTSRQLRFARLLLAEQGRAKLSGLLADTLGQLESADDKSPAWAIPFGDPPAQLAELLQAATETGEPALPAPNPDVFNLWRFAGLLALLPQRFTARVSFSLNELAADQRYRLTVLRGAKDGAPAAKGSSLYVEWCLDRLEKGEQQRLSDFRTWLGERLNEPSLAALDGLTELYDQVATLEAPGDKIEPSRISGLIERTRRAARFATIDEFVIAASTWIAQLEPGQDQTRLSDQLIDLIRAIDRPLSEPVLDELISRAPADRPVLRDWLEALPERARAQLSQRALQEGRQNAWKSLLDNPGESQFWLVRNIAPHLPPEAQTDLAQKALEVALADDEALVVGVDQLLRASDALAPAVRTTLVDQMQQRITRRAGSLASYVRTSLQRGSPSVTALAKLVNTSRATAEAVLEWFPPHESADGYLDFLDQVQASAGLEITAFELYHEIARILTLAGRTLVSEEVAPRRVEGERPLIEVVSEPRRLGRPEEYWRAGGFHGEWTDSDPLALQAHVCRSRNALQSERDRGLILRHLYHAIENLPVARWLVFVSAYADELADAKQFAVLEAALQQLGRSAAEATRWLVRPSVPLGEAYRIRPLDRLTKILVAAAREDSLDEVASEALGRIEQGWSRDSPEFWDLLTRDVAPRPLKRWRKLMALRAERGQFR